MTGQDIIQNMDSTVKFSSKIDRKVLEQLRSYAEESKKNISTVLTEAVEDYLSRVAIRPAFIDAVSEVIEAHSDLLERLAK